ncbi:MAG: biotin/lipoyl-containing protein, partial [Pseudomonadales bacterium]
YLAERDCSVQRRHQKIIEEAPAPGISADIRKKMGEAALEAASAIDYVGAGTVEFLFDSDGAFYFMEMNTRLQVEHPVTEFITGQDLVAWQLRVAAGEKLPLLQSDIPVEGHAIEVRIYAEDPANDFLPATGTLSFLQTPAEDEHLRIDTGVRQGDTVSVYYDPMIAKLVVWDEDRNKALRRMARALSEYHINGVTTNIDFLYNLVSCAPFMSAELDTGFIEKHRAVIYQDSAEDLQRDVPLAALYLVLAQQQRARQIGNYRDPHSPWSQASSWRMNQPNVHAFELQCQGQQASVSVEESNASGTHRYCIHYNGQQVVAQGSLQGNQLHSDMKGYRSQAAVAAHDGMYSVFTQHSVFQFSVVQADPGDEDGGSHDGGLNAPMNGTIVELSVAAGSKVEKGDSLLVMEAMKMEHTIRAPAAGRVKEFYYQAGSLVEGGAELLNFEVGE